LFNKQIQDAVPGALGLWPERCCVELTSGDERRRVSARRFAAVDLPWCRP
jgi:hypothetical protein